MSPEVPGPALAEVPRLSTSVRVEPMADADQWLVTVDGVPVSRASAATAELLCAMDGTNSIVDLHRRFAPEYSDTAFADLLDRFRRAGLLRGSERPPAGRVTYRPPLTIQFATLRAPQLFDALHRALRPAFVSWMPWVVVVSVVLGAVALILQTRAVVAALTSPLPTADVLLVASVLVVATFAHEAAHGVTLTHAGARPRRAGVMLLYLGPAFFVDVTDAWRLPSRRSRVAVALAGPAVHALIAAAAAVSALAAPDADVRRTLLVLSCACTTVVLVNLVPFVRFDGYIALMSALDEPSLRARTMADAGAAVRRVLFGAPRAPRALARWWSVPFGALSVLVPTALVWFALERTVRALSGAGAIGALLVLALQATVVLAVGVPVVRWITAGVRRGPRRARGLALGAVVLAAGVVALAAVPVPDTRSAGFAVIDGRVALVVPIDDSAAVPLPGPTSVSLTTAGILGDARVAEGTAHPQTPETVSVPLSALAPFDIPGVEVEATSIAAIDAPADAALPSTGRASVELGTRSVLSQVWAAHVVAPVSTLLTALTPSPSPNQEGHP